MPISTTQSTIRVSSFVLEWQPYHVVVGSTKCVDRDSSGIAIDEREAHVASKLAKCELLEENFRYAASSNEYSTNCIFGKYPLHTEEGEGIGKSPGRKSKEMKSILYESYFIGRGCLDVDVLLLDLVFITISF